MYCEWEKFWGSIFVYGIFFVGLMKWCDRFCLDIYFNMKVFKSIIYRRSLNWY